MRKTDVLAGFGMTFLLSLGLAQPARAVATQVGVALEIEAPAVQDAFGPDRSDILRQSFYDEILPLLRKRLEYWQIDPDAGVASYTLVFYIFQGVKGLKRPELKIQLFVRQDGREVVTLPPRRWREPDDESGFDLRTLPGELSRNFSQMLAMVALVRGFKGNVPIGVGGHWLDRGTLGLDLPKDLHGGLIHSGFKIRIRQQRQTCEVHGNGTGEGYVNCPKKTKCLEVEPVCCALGKQSSQTLCSNVPSLRSYSLNDIFFVDYAGEYGPRIYEPRKCK